MLVRATHVIGLKILTLEDGKKIGTVHDIIYDPQDNAIKAFVVENGGLFSSPKVILTKNILSIGRDALMIPNDQVIENASKSEDKVADIAKEDTYLTKTKIVTEDGTVLGSVDDVYFDDKTGRVEELEVSEGGFKTLQSGRKRVKIHDVVTIGKDATIVKAYTTQELEEQSKGQGIQGALNTARANVTSFFQSAPQTTKKTGRMIEGKAREITQTTEEKAKDIKRNPKVKDFTQAVKTQSQKATERIKQLASESNQAAKQTVQQAKENTKQKREEDALGKYLTVNLLGKDDTIIAKRGDMITHELLETAESQNKLDKVLSSISEEPIAEAKVKKKHARQPKYAF